jgi:hypothetical protein
MPAYLRKPAQEFQNTSQEVILGVLTARAADSGFLDLKNSQITEWKETTPLLQSALSEVCRNLDQAKSWGILLEYTIPLRQKRIDAVVLAGDVILVIEFKASDTHDAYARRQVEDYALDLRDFHAKSNERKTRWQDDCYRHHRAPEKDGDGAYL